MSGVGDEGMGGSGCSYKIVTQEKHVIHYFDNGVDTCVQLWDIIQIRIHAHPQTHVHAYTKRWTHLGKITALYLYQYPGCDSIILARCDY